MMPGKCLWLGTILLKLRPYTPERASVDKDGDSQVWFGPFEDVPPHLIAEIKEVAYWEHNYFAISV